MFAVLNLNYSHFPFPREQQTSNATPRKRHIYKQTTLMHHVYYPSNEQRIKELKLSFFSPAAAAGIASGKENVWII